MPEHESVEKHGSPAQEVGDFLRRRGEQVAQRWADEPLFRTVFTVSRDEAVEAGKIVVEALAQVADTNQVHDPDAAGFTVVREQLSRMGAARSRAGFTTAQVSNDVNALRPPVENLLLADLPDASADRVRECTTALTVLMGTLRLVVLETALSEGQALIERQRLQL
ncbi:RsbRD N-terminal domain-containing protein, partial [Streptomyces resistomycificus]